MIPDRARIWVVRTLRLAAAGCLGVDAYVHAHLAPIYAGIHAAISQATLFRIEASLAGLAALAVLVSGRRSVRLFAFLIAAGGLAAVLLYRYVNVGQLGPLPNMYEPTWFTEKTLSAFVEGAAAFLMAISLLPLFNHATTEKDQNVTLASPDASGRRHLRTHRLGLLRR